MNQNEQISFVPAEKYDVSKEGSENLSFWENEDEELPRPETVTVVQDELADDPDPFPIFISDPLGVDPLSEENRTESPNEPVNEEQENNSKVCIKIELSDSDDGSSDIRSERVPEDDGYRSGSDEGAAGKNRSNRSHLNNAQSTRKEVAGNKVTEELPVIENANDEIGISAQKVTSEAETSPQIDGVSETQANYQQNAGLQCPEVACAHPKAISKADNVPEEEKVPPRRNVRASKQKAKVQLGSGSRVIPRLETKETTAEVPLVDARQTRNARASKEWAKVQMCATLGWPKCPSPKKRISREKELPGSIERTLCVVLTRCKEAERLVSSMASVQNNNVSTLRSSTNKIGGNEVAPVEDSQTNCAEKIPRLKIRKISGSSGWEMATIGDDCWSKNTESVKLPTSSVQTNKFEREHGVLGSRIMKAGSAQNGKNDFPPENKFKINSETSVSREKTPDGGKGDGSAEEREKLGKHQTVERSLGTARKSLDTNQGAVMKSWSCWICYREFENPFSMSGHVRHCKRKFGLEEIKKLPYTCKLCGKSFNRKADLLSHTATHAVGLKYKCHICGKNFFSSSDLKLHSETHEIELTYKCDVCEASFASMRALNMHKSKVGHKSLFLTNETFLKPVIQNKSNVSELFHCEICNLVFHTLIELQEHQVVHTEQLNDIKNHKISRGSSLQEHKIYHDVKPYQCDMCPKGFYTQPNLKIHMNKHIGIRPYKCEKCESAFYDPWSLKRHKCSNVIRNELAKNVLEPADSFVSTHDGRDTKKVIVNRSTVKYTKRKKYLCRICKKSVTSASSLRVHMFLHNGKPLRCCFCDKKFSVSIRLKDHIRAWHTFERPYKCNMCEKAYTGSNSLRLHKLSKHRLVDSRLKPHSNLTVDKCDITNDKHVQEEKENEKSNSKCQPNGETFKCDECSAMFFSHNYLVMHKNNFHLKKKKKKRALVGEYKCDKCEATFNLYGTLHKHQQRFHSKKFTGTSAALESYLKKRPYQCNFCNGRYHLHQNLLKHISRNHGAKKQEKLTEISYKCNKCNITFSNHSSLYRHSLHFHSENSALYECNPCSAVFRLPGTLIRHNRRYHSEKMKDLSASHFQSRGKIYKCNQCDAKFNLRSAWLKHICHFPSGIKKEASTVRSTVTCFSRKHKCDLCQAKFVWKSSLDRHKREVHRGKGEDGQETFKIDPSSKMYECDLCPAKFQWITSISRHKREVHSEKREEGQETFKIDPSSKMYECDLCPAKFQWITSISRHKHEVHREKGEEGQETFKIGPSSKMYECVLCPAKFKWRTSLSRHKREAHGEKGKEVQKAFKIDPPSRTYVCDLCPAKFHCSSNLTRHKHVHREKEEEEQATNRIAPNSKKHVCDLCSATFNWRTGLSRHKRKVHGGKDKEGHETSEIDSHSKTYECDLCPAKFYWSSSFSRHKREVHKRKESLETSNIPSSKMYECDLCHAKYNWNCSLRRHIRKVHRKKGKARHEATKITPHSKMYECDLCSAKFDLKGNLNRHKVEVHKEKGKARQEGSEIVPHSRRQIHKCNLCSAKYTMRSNLLRHQRTCHFEEESYQCTVCLKSFSSAVVLVKHHEKHFKKLNYSCSTCGKSFEVLKHLKDHMLTHSSVTHAFPCDICSLSFQTSHDWENHKQSHVFKMSFKAGNQESRELALRKHRCDVCKKVFKNKYTLKRHKIIHADKCPYQCVVCGQAFQERYKLVLHMGKHSADV